MCISLNIYHSLFLLYTELTLNVIITFLLQCATAKIIQNSNFNVFFLIMDLVSLLILLNFTLLPWKRF